MHYVRVPCDTYTKVLHTMKYDILDLDPPIRFMNSNIPNYVDDFYRGWRREYPEELIAQLNAIIIDETMNDDDRNSCIHDLYNVTGQESRTHLFKNLVNEETYDGQLGREYARKTVESIVDTSKRVRLVLYDILNILIHVAHPEYLDLEDLMDEFYDQLMELHNTLSTYNEYVKLRYKFRQMSNEDETGSFMYCHAIKHVTNTIEKIIKLCGKCKLPIQPYALYVHRSIYDPKKDLVELVTQKYHSRFLILPENRITVNRFGEYTVTDRLSLRDFYGHNWHTMLNHFETESDLYHTNYTRCDEYGDDNDDFDYDPPDEEPEDENPDDDDPEEPEDRYDRHYEHNSSDPYTRLQIANEYAQRCNQSQPVEEVDEDEDDERNNDSINARARISSPRGRGRMPRRARGRAPR